MSKVKIKMENFATEQDFEAAVSSMNESMGDGNNATPAQQVRDANGKLIAVEVGIPSNLTAAEKKAARDAAINNNPGVSKASIIPVGGRIEDFEAIGAEGTDLKANSIQFGDASLSLSANWLDRTSSFGGLSSDPRHIEQSAVGEGKGGTGQAARARHGGTATNSGRKAISAWLAMDTANNGISDVTSMKIAGSANIGKNTGLGSVDQPTSRLRQMFVILNNPQTFLLAQWQVNPAVGSGASNSGIIYMSDQATGFNRIVPATFTDGYVDFELSVDNNGDITYTWGAETYTHSRGLILPHNGEFSIVLDGSDSALQAEEDFTFAPMFLDDAEMTVRDVL